VNFKEGGSIECIPFRKKGSIGENNVRGNVETDYGKGGEMKRTQWIRHD